MAWINIQYVVTYKHTHLHKSHVKTNTEINEKKKKEARGEMDHSLIPTSDVNLGLMISSRASPTAAWSCFPRAVKGLAVPGL